MKQLITAFFVLIYNPLNSNVIDNYIDDKEYTSIKIAILEQQINQINIDSLRNKSDLTSKYFNNIKVNNSVNTVYNMKDVWEYMYLKYNIPKYISISFWIQETGWGSSKLFKNGYNLGGIRAKVGFRKYKSLLAAVDDYARVLTMDRYIKHVKHIDICDYREWVTAYDKGGYWGSETGIPDRIYHIEKLRLHEL